MTAGFFSPLPPARSGVADYSAALFREMRRLGSVRLDDTNADVRLYHLGNNQMHRGIYNRALNEPGVAVLHDAVLQHFFLGSLGESAYVEEFTYNYGRWTEQLAARLWQHRARSGADPLYFRYPMLRRIAERSRAVVVHNRAAARIVLDHAPSARIHIIPHLYLEGPQPAPYDVLRFRARLGAAPSTCIFGVFGHLRESKRLPTVLRAFDSLQRAGLRCLLLIAGDFASSDLARATLPLLRRPGIVRSGYTPECEFALHAHAVDACVNLRYPAAGETSGISIRMMGIGKPVLVTRGEESADIPETALLRVEPGAAEADSLTSFMIWLARFRDDARAIGERARRHIAEHHSSAQIAAEYWSVLAESRG